MCCRETQARIKKAAPDEISKIVYNMAISARYDKTIEALSLDATKPPFLIQAMPTEIIPVGICL